jgi:DNA-binding NtrC family response regulator
MSQVKKTEKQIRILVVDDHAKARDAVADVLRQAAYDVATCTSAIEALGRLAAAPVDVVITDLQMPGMSGLDFIREIERRRLDVQVLMITAHASVSSAVEAMRLGAFDYIEKPFNALALERSVAQACERRRLYQHSGDPSGSRLNHNSRDLTRSPANGDATSKSAFCFSMIGNSPAMQELRQRIAQIAATEETVLICGESGTGKELVAKTIHALSRRAGGPLVSLNCPAGSILLDEITEIDINLQAKLLRVLQERSFEPVGSSETTAADVRVIATTNRNMAAEIAEGRFREDLYYRLAVVPVHVPPLREREGDVLELAEHFLANASQRLERGPFVLENDARDLLASYDWPGNVRELQNIVTRACVLNRGAPIGANELRPWLRDNRPVLAPSTSEADEPAALPVGLTLDEVERRMIVATLERFGGHRAKAAEALGIGLRTLSGKLRAYGYAPRERDFARTG